MFIKKLFFLSFALLFCINMVAQTGSIKGRVYNEINNESIPFANIILEGTQIGATSDENGNYQLDEIQPGTYNLICSFVGFTTVYVYEIIVGSTATTEIDIALTEESALLDQVVIQTNRIEKSQVSPLSKQTIGATEIYRNPGSNRDISKVIQILPGVATTVSFRNDIIVRGGAPNENRFYLDGIEIPNINHFATQGSSGGPVGMINVNFIRDVDFYSGAFPANRGNTMSSVMEFQQITGNREKFGGSFMVGSSDIGLTLNGPTGENSSFILSARRSYLQFLFQALKLPFLPTYNDFQYKHFFELDEKNQLTLVGLGAIDDFELNEDVNDGETDQETIDRNNYILGNLPVNSQWNYAIGANWKHFSKNSFQNVVISRNHLNNKAVKYRDNIEIPEELLYDYSSEEIENKLRVESTKRKNGWNWNIGAGFQHVVYKNSTFNKKAINGEVQIIDFDSEFSMQKYELFTQISKAFFSERLSLSFGIRTDANSYSDEMSNFLDQLSPRFSASYQITEKFAASFNLGRYYQLPAYTVMGYRDNDGNLVNKENGITYIQSDHFVGGVEYNPTKYSKITVEGFYKKYDNYPFLTNDSISLANLGGDFGVIGNEPAIPTSVGRSYGIEFFLQQKLSSSVYGLISYTFVRSEFEDKNGDYVASSWDNRHVLNVTAGKKLRKNWELGAKFRFLGGSPYTPYDIEQSSRKEIWDVTQRGINDWDLLNTERNGNSHGLDLRVDKRWYFKKWALNAYLDIQNIYNFKTETQPFLDVVRDENGDPIEDPADPERYLVREIENTTGTVLPSIGIMIEF
ncbi:TonB-dependent receptor [Lutimonas saemankumensis]|uniref:TonB-dependent receptor n=1 Tax=Lutimonas saemankumensis TaxID=483016 RepID=UPI001CD5C843|nr:TonB-dependent receptor [Lutimonas saemankumensis]MCA0933796.1 TonB-dependent receptor [Lutimonas saemankumensis]